MSDTTRGLYGKFEVKRTDGSSGSGGKHERCWYFVLDPQHDKFAAAALLAYADACAAEYPRLAEDLRTTCRLNEDEWAAAQSPATAPREDASRPAPQDAKEGGRNGG